jgi:hypothetical protein
VPAGEIAPAARRPWSRLASRIAGRLLFRRVPLRPDVVAALRGEAEALAAGRGDAIDLWEGLRRDLRECLRHGDPAEFLRWPPVRKTMVKRSHRRVRPELEHLRSRPDWSRRWRSALRETTLGGPRPLPRWPWSSANLIYQAYHLCRFEEVTGRSIAAMRTILEFGGGYGRLCQLAHDLGFSGTYVIFDLPEVSVLQRFYLRHVGIPVSPARPDGWPAAGAVTVADLGDLLTLLRARPAGDAAFVAIGSLSESPLPLREALRPALEEFDAFLMLYAATHDGIDNSAYFADWPARFPGHAWHDEEIPHQEKASHHLFAHRIGRPSG